jgi:hypothetical protein
MSTLVILQRDVQHLYFPQENDSLRMYMTPI